MSERQYKVRTTDDVAWSDGLNVTGVVTDLGHLEIDGKRRPFVVVDTGGTLARVFHSEALDDVFKQAARGDSVSLTALPMVKTKAGRTYRPFSVQLWTESKPKA